ncbi:hypothetical protein [Mariluticola halotolerans]|uniref:hypothetical protein n=1 Tax=Mariluticola halotolerans TaxID=2909283 RepID=UPI0026E4885F|nr:hypothetical protein [Mariluticola halotolerans]UJQ95751.1 hypothetical protein L1P08_07130 [Mariluticola halotolerans]
MGELVRFDKRGRIIPEQTGQKRKGQVLMFTGIRYERAAPTESGDDDSGSKPTQKRG